MLQITEHRFIAFDETPINYFKQAARPPKKAALLILHGMGEHGRRYVPISGFLSEQGIECYVPDLRGHGKSGGARGHVNRFPDFFHDLRALHALAEKQNPGVPLFMLGHSLGGLIVAGYVTAPEQKKPTRAYAGIILSSPLFGIIRRVAWPRRAVAAVASLLCPSHAENTQVNAAELTHDPAIIEEYGHDERIHTQITARFYTELMAMLKARDDIARQFPAPLLLIQAGEDRIVSKQASLDFFNGVLAADKTLEIYDGFYHEVFNEIGRLRAFERVGSWISRHPL